MQQNNDLKVALKQIQFANLGYKQSKWGNVPKIDATIGGATLTRPSNNSMNGASLSSTTGSSYTQDYTSSINISWEADFWRKVSSAKESALSDYMQTQEAAKAVKTRLVAEVVSGYYNLLMLDKQLEISKENLRIANQTLVILKKQYELGMITSLAVQQQENAKDLILKNIPAIENSINVQENGLNILTGTMPDKIERQKSIDNVETPDQFFSGVPAELLSYRPDIKSAELNFRKSLAAIHMAKANMYPSLRITAQSGLNSMQASNWFNIPGPLFGMVAGTLAQPILNGKQLKTNYEQSKITSEQAEINFKQSILKAVGEVSDALVQIQKLKQQQKVAENLTKKADEVVKNSMTLYKYNEATYLEVLLVQNNKLQAELDLASIKTQNFTAITTLYRSLGGGWQ